MPLGHLSEAINSECGGRGKPLGGGLYVGTCLHGEGQPCRMRRRRQSSFAVTSSPTSIPAAPLDNPTLPYPVRSKRLATGRE